eukprot:TRINITY_DN80989_c0_g1_i1.p1 TRINITY_DN80989_c0_g1~~TRINITY_DN80989_c0_g1_i1.p1  ORF type:complete len:214 (+),score=74.15 TRINITY_DN80989_c0_g1_i1:85-726(+)
MALKSSALEERRAALEALEAHVARWEKDAEVRLETQLASGLRDAVAGASEKLRRAEAWAAPVERAGDSRGGQGQEGRENLAASRRREQLRCLQGWVVSKQDKEMALRAARPQQAADALAHLENVEAWAEKAAEKRLEVQRQAEENAAARDVLILERLESGQAAGWVDAATERHLKTMHEQEERVLRWCVAKTDQRRERVVPEVSVKMYPTPQT